MLSLRQNNLVKGAYVLLVALGGCWGDTPTLRQQPKVEVAEVMESVELPEEVSLRTQFTVDDLDIEILPLIYEIIRRYVFLLLPLSRRV